MRKKIGFFITLDEIIAVKKTIKEPDMTAIPFIAHRFDPHAEIARAPRYIVPGVTSSKKSLYGSIPFSILIASNISSASSEIGS